MEILELFTQNITSPPILFFVVGVIAGFLKSDLN
ncbi:MAG: sodium-dependent bicarbonate transport family permease, partial [Rickettsiales bacterium]|nr:sodium-dependent bicarbonate transport family permease [Rickettsiales bacterium]